MEPSGEQLNELAKYLERGDIKAVIDTEGKSLDDYKVAFDKLWSERAKGKCVINVVPK